MRERLRVAGPCLIAQGSKLKASLNRLIYFESAPDSFVSQQEGWFCPDKIGMLFKK
jgi:hypothetical protein